ncbi:MAG: hypothetical protein CMJ78_16000 [Planctomycetaceae bacterium]|nr:hypothetical protein [Planctomycetaceae bacterium]
MNYPFRVTVLLSFLVLSGCIQDSDVSQTTEQVPANIAPPEPAADVKVIKPQILVVPSPHQPNAVIISIAANANWPELYTSHRTELEAAITLSRRDQDNAESTTSVLGDIALGEHTGEAPRLLFQPSFPLVPGDTYVARVDLSKLPLEGSTNPAERVFTIPRGDQTPPVIIDSYPSGPIVPANHLKFYINFSHPMEQGDIFQHFSLRDETTGENVPRPFRHTELWSKDNRRLTLWFHPGRQKDGVNLNVEIGPVLEPEHEYSLVVSGDWRGENQVPLGTDYEKRFRAGPQDRLQPNPETWLLSSPRVESKDIFRCDLHEPLDWALMHSAVHIEHEDSPGTAIKGKIEPGYGELSWNFQPEQPWHSGTYRLAIKTIIEDLAGNNLEQPFEVDITKETESEPPPKYVYRKFDCVPVDE